MTSSSKAARGARRKLAGILAEATSAPEGLQYVILGFGINLGPAAYPPELADRATSIEVELGRAVDGSCASSRRRWRSSPSGSRELERGDSAAGPERDGASLLAVVARRRRRVGYDRAARSAALPPGSTIDGALRVRVGRSTSTGSFPVKYGGNRRVNS